jgi:hypothetical protein
MKIGLQSHQSKNYAKGVLIVAFTLELIFSALLLPA